jgi:hypothetical protein
VQEQEIGGEPFEQGIMASTHMEDIVLTRVLRFNFHYSLVLEIDTNSLGIRMFIGCDGGDGIMYGQRQAITKSES